MKNKQLESAILEFKELSKTPFSGCERRKKIRLKSPVLPTNDVLRNINYSNYSPEQLKGISESLWLPTDDNSALKPSVDIVSWFSMKHVQNKDPINPLPIFYSPIMCTHTPKEIEITPV